MPSPASAASTIGAELLNCQWPVHPHAKRFSVLLELPVHRARRAGVAIVDAAVTPAPWVVRAAFGGEIAGRGHGDQAASQDHASARIMSAHRRFHPADARVEPILDDVAEPFLQVQFQLDVGISRQDRTQLGQTTLVIAWSDRSSGCAPQVGRGNRSGRHFRLDLGDPGGQRRLQPFARLGRGDAAGGAMQQAQTDPRLQPLYVWLIVDARCQPGAARVKRAPRPRRNQSNGVDCRVPCTLGGSLMGLVDMLANYSG